MLPPASTPAEFHAIARDEARLRPGVDAICRDLGIGGAITRFSDGSLPVYAVGPAVLKLYPPPYLEEREREHLVLTVLAGRLPIPTPGPLATGEHEGWGWILMERLAGESLAVRWPELADPSAVARAIGVCLAALHAVRDPRLDELRGSWATFEAEQRRTAVDRQRARGLDARWLAQIPAFLEDLALDGPPVLLHTEVMREHLRIDGDRLTGLFDFEPARRGPPEYELASVGLFVSNGDPTWFREILRGYGISDPDPELPRRILGHALLHQYSNLRWYLERVPPPAGAETLDDLATAWFTT